ncbi:ATP-binding protein [Candidatus Electronema halotolerans]
MRADKEYQARLDTVLDGPLAGRWRMIAGQRSPRNPLIMEILRDYGYVDAPGMGVRTKVIPLMRQHNGVEPVFEVSEDCLKIVLPRKGGGL